MAREFEWKGEIENDLEKKTVTCTWVYYAGYTTYYVVYLV